MPLLEVANLHAHYNYAPVLQGLSFAVDAGEIVSVFGRNGAGKTTALRTIMGWLRPSRGSITFEGRSIGGLSILLRSCATSQPIPTLRRR